MSRQIIQNSFQAGELSPQMYMRTDLKGTRYGVRQATNWRPTRQGPISPRPRTKKSTFVTESTSDNESVMATLIDSAGTGVLAWLISGAVVANAGAIYRSTTKQSLTLNYNCKAEYIREAVILQPPGIHELYVFLRNRAPYKIVGGSTWTIADLSFTAIAHTDISAACFFQNRLYVAKGHQIWASKTGSFLDFTIGTNPADAFVYALSDPVQIQWMHGLKNLVVGTDQYEYIITAQDGVVMPGDINVTRQSNYGSYGPALPVGIGVLYRSADQKKLRLIKYNYMEDQWVTKNLLFASEHLTKDTKIVNMAYDPIEENIYCVLDNGDMLFGLYNPGEDTVGWVPQTFNFNAKSVHVHKANTTTYTNAVYIAFNSGTNHYLVTEYTADWSGSTDLLADFTNTGGSLGNYLGAGTVVTLSSLLPNIADIVVAYRNVPTLTELLTTTSIAAPAYSAASPPYTWLVYNSSTITVGGTTGDYYYIITHTASNGYIKIPLSVAGGFSGPLVLGEKYLIAFDYRIPTGGHIDQDFFITIQNLITDASASHNHLWEMNPSAANTTWTRVTFDFIADEEATTTEFFIYCIRYLYSNVALHLRNITLSRMVETTTELIVDGHTSDASGKITLQHTCEFWEAGVKYDCTLETMAFSTQAEDMQNTYKHKKRMPKAFVRVIDSYPAEVDGRTPSEYVKGDQDIQVSTSGWDQDATLLIEQKAGYRTEIAGIFGEVAEHTI